MKTRLLLFVTLAVCGAGRLTAEEPGKPESSNATAWFQFLASEIRELRRELLEDRLERQEAKVRGLQREVERAGAMRQDGETVQRTQDQELAKMDERLADPALDAEERAQLATQRAEVMAQDQADHATLTQKEAELGAQLGHERQHLESLRALARSLTAIPPSK